MAEWLEHWTCNSEALNSSPTLTASWLFVHGSSKFKSSATLVNSQVVWFRTVGFLDPVTFNLNYLFQAFARPHYHNYNYFSCGTLVRKCQSDCFNWPRCMNWNKFPFDFNSFPKLPFTFYVICFGKFHLSADTFKILMRVRGILISPLQKSITNQSTVLMF